MPITTNVVSSNPVHGEVYSNNIMWSSLSVTRDRSVVFSGYSVFPTNKTDRHNITEIVLKVALNTIHQPTKPSVGCEKTIMMNQYRLLLITTELKLQSLNNWMLSFFRNQNRSLLHMQNINCKSHWWTDKLTTIKMGIYQVRYACYLYFIFFSIDSSEEMWLEKKLCLILSVNKENVLTFWICAFEILIANPIHGRAELFCCST